MSVDQPGVPLEKTRTWLMAIWFGGGGVILAIVIVQSQLGAVGDNAQKLWAWLLPTLMPTLGVMLSSIAATALNPSETATVVRQSFSRLAILLSCFYLLLIFLELILRQSIARDANEWLVKLQASNLWLGPIQGLTATVIGTLFVTKKEKAKD